MAAPTYCEEGWYCTLELIRPYSTRLDRTGQPDCEGTFLRHHMRGAGAPPQIHSPNYGLSLTSRGLSKNSMRALGIQIANGYSPEARILSGLLGPRDLKTDVRVLMHSWASDRTSAQRFACDARAD